VFSQDIVGIFPDDSLKINELTKAQNLKLRKNKTQKLRRLNLSSLPSLSPSPPLLSLFFHLPLSLSGALPLRLLTPPALFFFLLPRTNPHLSQNLGSYYKELESQYLPSGIKETRESVFQSWRDLKSKVGEGVKGMEDGSKKGWEKAKGEVEGVTGLKVGGK